MAKKSKLTLKQQRFLTNYLQHGNATKAAEEAGYSSTSRMSLGAQAYENLKNPHIQDAISQALTSAEITPEWIMLQYKELAISGYAHNRLRALENLSRVIQLSGFESPVSQSKTLVTGPITISFATNQLPERTVIDQD